MSVVAAVQVSESEPPTDLIDFVVKKGNGVTGLSQLNLKSLPHHYIHPIEERFDPTYLQSESVPVIDVSNWADPKVAASICEAASKRGFFQIVGHGVPEEVMVGVKGASHRFFGLPVEERRKYLKENSGTGTVELKTSFSPEKEKVLEWRDILFHFYGGNDNDNDNERYKDWPSVSKDQVLEYMKWTKPLIKKLIELLMEGLNVKDPMDEAKESLLMGTLLVNLLYYPKCPNPELTVGSGRHSDISTITVLLQDDVGGLYVRGGTHSDHWIHVTPVKGALVINIGDVLQILSNDRYKSVEHRVMVNAHTNRVSVPIFVNPGPGAIIGPLAEVLEKGEQALYKQLLYSDYYSYFFSKGHDGKQTIEFAKV